jgi:hypothetical protein
MTNHPGCLATITLLERNYLLAQSNLCATEMDDITNTRRSRVTLVIDVGEYDGQWRVRLHRNVYSEHANEELARRAALALAADARQLGYDVEVWDSSTGERLR